jgi:tetratricopeptide (TPR) repeat protein
MPMRVRVLPVLLGFLMTEVAACTACLYLLSTAALHRGQAESPTRQPAPRGAAYRPEDAEPRFDGLGDYSRTITTRSRVAQEYFTQGLAFLYSFNPDEASQSFEAAALADPECAMAYWGVAISNGPNLNNFEIGQGVAVKAFGALTRAQTMAGNATGVERALIRALSARLVDPPPAVRGPLDRAYSAAMRDVWTRYPNDPDVGALAADAYLNLNRWDYWTLDGKPREGTLEAIGILKSVLAQHPNHPYALHLLVHAAEGSPHPEIALPAADRLRCLAPGLEHLLHMPSHIDVRLGHWDAALSCNERAIAAGRRYRSISDIPDTRQNMGMAIHNHCMLAYCAMMQGQRRKATEAVHEMFSEIPSRFIEQNSRFVDPYRIIPYEVRLRFGEWQEMLAEPRPGVEFPAARAFWNYARGIAFAARNEVREAKEEQRQFLINRKSVPVQSQLRSNSMRQLMDVAEKMLAGEILYRAERPTEALAALREGVRLEDNLIYSEPPDWMMPVRHALGAMLIATGRAADAESVFRADLGRYPENGWSLYGLARSLRMAGKHGEAAAVAVRFEKAWQYADFEILSSCCCLPVDAKSAGTLRVEESSATGVHHGQSQWKADK